MVMLVMKNLIYFRTNLFNANVALFFFNSNDGDGRLTHSIPQFLNSNRHYQLDQKK